MRHKSQKKRILRDAAVATREWTIENSLTDADAAAAFCAEGGTIAAASDAQLDELQDAATPVLDVLMTDPAVADIITEIDGLKVIHPDPAPVTECAASAPGVGSTTIDGTYTLEVTREDFEERGVTDEGDIGQNLGEFTWTFAAGRYTYEQLMPDGRLVEGAGDYTVDRGEFTLYWSHEPGEFSAATVQEQADGSLLFTDLRDGLGDEYQPVAEALFGAHPFETSN